MFARDAAAFTCVFRYTLRHSMDLRPIRTGQPIRLDLRRAAIAPEKPISRTVLVVGGSQGSEFLNETVPVAASRLKGVRFVHATGPKNIEKAMARVRSLDLRDYDARPYLETDEMVAAYRSADLVIARSGGTLAEIALFGLPSVLVPLPTSADDHQLHNAEEFVEMRAASLLLQGSTATPAGIAAEVEAWLSDSPRYLAARKALLEWDSPDATPRIVKRLQEAAR
jgi:UDP-N-acetylglucosamine--N-acetylmuramyl-(pentapeptide) pyrophosphoryl-undecaprenol N-acetylglucosamine transferase